MTAFTFLTGIIMSILFLALIVPQIIKTFKTKQAKGVSVLTYWLQFCAYIIAIMYAYTLPNANEPQVFYPLCVGYTVGFVLTSIYLLLYYFWVKKGNR